MDFDEIKAIILTFLKTNETMKFSTKKLYDTMKEKYPTIITMSFPTFQRAVDILAAEKMIISEDFDFVRFVWCKND